MRRLQKFKILNFPHPTVVNIFNIYMWDKCDPFDASKFDPNIVGHHDSKYPPCINSSTQLYVENESLPDEYTKCNSLYI